jgi:hypothetical protein
MTNFSDFILITKVPIISGYKEINGTTAEGPGLNEFQSHLQEHREIIDSIEPKNSVNRIYKTIIQEKANALLLDIDGLDFYRYELGIESQLENCGKEYVNSLIHKISNQIKSLSREYQPFKKLFHKTVAQK